ncbi:MAG: fatty acid desaturase [Burkholderiales bacterium]|jgi:stearoyl-CoA desaturase (delta-9 desaturase)
MNGLLLAWEGLIAWLADGLLNFSGWQILAFTLLATHVTIASVTIFLHRSQAHRSLDLHPLISHFFRFWLWLTTGMVTKQWVAIHRKHHAKCETQDDPHSPVTRGIKTVLLRGSELYRAEAKVQETLEKYGHQTPNDWIERNLYSRFSWQGVALMLILNIFMFGAIGLTVWAVQMLWIPITAAGIINGLGHWWGYRNFEATDASTNISPWGILIGGEELHNNHHTYPTSAKLSVKPFEFDIGWLYICILQALGLAKVRKTPPLMKMGTAKAVLDGQTLQAIITHRYEVMAKYASDLRAACSIEIKRLKAEGSCGSLQLAQLKLARRWLHRDNDKIPAEVRPQLLQVMQISPCLSKLVLMREELRQLWTRTNVSAEQLLSDLQEWCRKAEDSGIVALRDFSLQLRAVHAV